MTIRRGGACDQRRRRVLLEENLSLPSGDASASPRQPRGTPPSERSSEVRAYSEAALESRQPPITSMLPRRLWTLFVLGLGGLAAIAGILAAYGQLFLVSRGMELSPWRSLDVQAAGSLASWYSSMILLAAGWLSFQVLRLRRHKTDDYRGRYRVWVWITGLFFLAAAFAGTQLAEDLLAAMGKLVHWQDPVQWQWIARGALIIALMVLSLRMAFEVHESRGSLFMLGLATGCYLAAMALRTFAMPEVIQSLQKMLESALIMLGHLTAFMAVAIYARHVYRAAQGLLQRKPRADKQKCESTTEGDRDCEGKREGGKQRAQRAGNAEDQSTRAPASPAAAPIKSQLPNEASKGEVQGQRQRQRRREKNESSADHVRKSQPEPELQPESQPAPAVAERQPAESDQEQQNAPSRKLSKAERRRMRKAMRRKRKAA